MVCGTGMHTGIRKNMTKRNGCIGVISMGKVPWAASEIISKHIHSLFELQTEILPQLDTPSYALDLKRNQYNAATILKALESMEFESCDKVIALLNVDLFIPVFTHVFGEAREGGTCAIASLYRLGRNLDDRETAMNRILDRACKVALHEVAHLFNMVHCTDEECLMHFSMNLDDLDALHLQLCAYCKAFLKDALSPFRPE